MVRQHYMTITCMGNIEVTYKENNFILEVTFERARGNNFQTAIFSIDGTLLSNNGFSMSDLSFCYNFLVNNANCILRIYRGEL